MFAGLYSSSFLWTIYFDKKSSQKVFRNSIKKGLECGWKIEEVINLYISLYSLNVRKSINF